MRTDHEKQDTARRATDEDHIDCSFKDREANATPDVRAELLGSLRILCVILGMEMSSRLQLWVSRSAGKVPPILTECQRFKRIPAACFSSFRLIQLRVRTGVRAGIAAPNAAAGRYSTRIPGAPAGRMCLSATGRGRAVVADGKKKGSKSVAEMRRVDSAGGIVHRSRIASGTPRVS